jgi:hypothetical protein
MKNNNEIKVVEIEETQFNQTLSSIKGFVKQINEKPVESDDPLSIRALKINGRINESFVSLCNKLDLNADANRLKKILNKSEESIAQIIADAAVEDLKSKNIHQSILPSIINANEQLIRQFAQVGKVLNQSYSQVCFLIFNATGKAIQIEDYIYGKEMIMQSNLQIAS